jgi:hypothetical protein
MKHVWIHKKTRLPHLPFAVTESKDIIVLCFDLNVTNVWITDDDKLHVSGWSHMLSKRKPLAPLLLNYIYTVLYCWPLYRKGQME